MPGFFDAAPAILMQDPLAAFLGAADDGILEYRYTDAVRLAGHSCPTVAAAFLMTRAGLAAIHAGGLPQRGAVRVDLREGRSAGTTGVVANVAALVTGAADEGGFKGIAGRYDRRRLLNFDEDFDGQLRFTRTDTGASATVAARLDRVPPDPRVAALLQRCLGGAAGAQEAALFRALWQARAQAILERADDPELIVVRVHDH